MPTLPIELLLRQNTPMKRFVWPLICLACIAAAVFVSREVWHHPKLLHANVRLTMIAEHLRQMPDAAVIVGDSLVERSSIRELCGLPVVNAGIGRATSASIMPVARMVKDRPLVVLAIGVNDGDSFAADYRALVRELRPDIVVGVTAHRERNAVIEAAASAYVEPLPPEFLYDGVHYTVDGEKEWRQLLETGCPDAMNDHGASAIIAS